MQGMKQFLASAAIGALVLAGCSTDPGASPTPTETITETVTATPTATPTPTSTSAPVDVCASLPSTADQLAFIFVSAPAPGTIVSDGFTVTGCSNSFEASYQWDVQDHDGVVIDDGFGTASCGTGCVGTFSFTVVLDSVPTTQTVISLRVFESSARDGSPVHVNTIPLIFQP